MASIGSPKSKLFRHIRGAQLTVFSLFHARLKDYRDILLNCTIFWVLLWFFSTLIPAIIYFFIDFLKLTPETTSSGFQDLGEQFIETLKACEVIHLLISGGEENSFVFLAIIAYTASAIITGYIFIAILRPKRVVTFANKVALTTKSNGSYLVFRFATSGSELYDLRAELDFSPEDARENPLAPDKDHIVFKLPNNEGSYSELRGVHELYFPLDSESRNDSKCDGSKHNDECRGIPSSVFPNSGNQPSAILRIIAHTANGHPVNASKEFILSKDASDVVRGDFAETLWCFTRGCFEGEKLYDFRNFNSIELSDSSSSN